MYKRFTLLATSAALAAACNGNNASTGDDTAPTGDDTAEVDDTNHPPFVAIQKPVHGSRHLDDEDILVQLTAYDVDESDPTALVLSWTGAADVDGAPEHPDSSGIVTWSLPAIAAGEYSFEVTVTDSQGATDTDSVDFTVEATPE